jgi:hypothetical protein
MDIISGLSTLSHDSAYTPNIYHKMLEAVDVHGSLMSWDGNRWQKFINDLYEQLHITYPEDSEGREEDRQIGLSVGNLNDAIEFIESLDYITESLDDDFQCLGYHFCYCSIALTSAIQKVVAITKQEMKTMEFK